MNKRDFVRAIKAAEKQEESSRRRQRRLAGQLARIIAREKGIKVGKQYKIVPINGRSRVVTVKEIGTAFHSDFSAISVLCHVENKNGEIKSEWVYTTHNEFVPVKDLRRRSSGRRADERCLQRYAGDSL